MSTQPDRRGHVPAVADQMHAAVLQGPGSIELQRVPTPTVGPDEVLVAVDLCGICGSDLHLVLEGWARPGTWQGHEWVGTVVAVGDDVDRWQIGDQVVGGPAATCGICVACRAQRPSLCTQRGAAGVDDADGAFATYKRAKASELLARPEELEPRAAALAEPLAVALHALHQGAVRPGHRVLVLGAGPIGALALAAMAAIGVEDRRCVEPSPLRRDLARAVGATTVLEPADLEVPSIAEPQRIVDGAVDVVLECSGKASAMEAGLAQLVRAGTLVLVGAGIEPPRFDPNRILLNELVVTGAYTYDHDGFARALELLGSGQLPVDDLLEPGVVALEDLLPAMRDLAAGRLAGKVLVQP
jgi:2-desacetyl-2-hydroxyethyl bacteriochlorophyllide A dehydrogenase